VEFFERHLCHTIGEWAGKPFLLMPWQREDVLMPLFGWEDAHGRRRYRSAYIEIPKKNGKSGMCSGIALYLMAADGEPGAQVFCAAASREQAGIVYREASAMARSSPLLRDYIVPSDSIKNLALPSANAFLRVISSESYTAEGLNIHGLIFDELHAQKTRDLWDALRYGGASRRQPLLVSITTAGWDRESICHEQHQRALGILDGSIEDDTFFAYIRAAEEGDDWKDPSVWRKANPSMGVTINEEDFAREAKEAQESPAKENAFKRYRLNIWTEQAERYLPMDRWDAIVAVVDADALRGRECYGGLDLSTTEDITAFVLVFPEQGGGYRVLPFFWIPQEGIRKRERLQRFDFTSAMRAGLVEATPGETIDYDRIRAKINALGKLYNIREIARDKWNATQITTQLMGDGFTLIDFGQGYKDMTAPTKELLRLVLEGKLLHGGNRVLRWMASHVAVDMDAAGNVKPTKERSADKIDGIVATIMAIGRAMLKQSARPSVYKKRGLLTL
jgi:phage terminase large subunit-like protein